MLKLLLLAATAAPSAWAWWADGHMLTAQIAYNILSTKSRAAVDSLASSLASDYPTSPDFVTASCWPDDIKSMGVTQYNNWHYVDLPVVRTGFWWNVPQTTNSSINPWAINSAIHTITTASATNLDKAIQLRFLIHFVGDLHQPLHAASLFSSQFANGDGGGNAFHIAGVNQTNLHSWWDSGGNLWATDLSRPLNSTGQQWLDDWVQNIVAAYPSSSFANQLAVTNVYQWAVDSNTLAETVAYTASQAPTPLSTAYQQLSQQTCMKQVALGGYRLAQVVESMFNPASATYGLYAKEATAFLEQVLSESKTHARLRAGRN